MSKRKGKVAKPTPSITAEQEHKLREIIVLFGCEVNKTGHVHDNNVDKCLADCREAMLK